MDTTTTDRPAAPAPARFGLLTTARRLAAHTPDDRNRYVDFLRALSILVVVFGHWLMAAPAMLDGELRIGHLISEARWAQWATWLLQVMPVFFFVGGFSNARSWRSARRDGSPYAMWLRSRLRRLVLPVLPVLAAWIAIATIALRTSLDTDLLRIASQAALVPVWFLATYVAIVALVPVSLTLWERHGWGCFWAVTGAAAAVDTINLGLGLSPVRWVNYLFVWNAVHLLGYAWVDGRVRGPRPAIRMAAAGLVSLAALVAALPYPLAMVGLDGAAVTNSNPPKLTLIALGVFQFGLAMAAEAAARRRLADLRKWTAVVTINASIMTLYLWHLTAMILVIGAAYGLGGVGLGVGVDTAGWWFTRPLWLATLIAATIPFLVVFGRFERPSAGRGPIPAVWRPVLGVIAICGGLGLLARFGVADASGLNAPALVLPFIGVTVGGVVSLPAQFARSRRAR